MSNRYRPMTLPAAIMAVLCVAAAGAPAAYGDDPRTASGEVSALIIGPLRSELATVPLAAQSLPVAEPAPSRRGYALRYSAAAPVFADDIVSARPAAARFAGSVLTAAGSDMISRDALAAFSAPQTRLAVTPNGGWVSLSLIDGAQPGSARLSFDADFAETAGRALTPELAARHRRMALNYEGSFDASGGRDGLDVGVSPRAGVSLGQDGTSAQAGATVRFGQYLGALDNDRPAWWFFAGADRQAVLYDPGQGFDMRGALVMQPYAMVGDAQAGIAVRVGATDVSLAYVHRETEYSMPQQSWDTSEGFAAFSLTWKR